MAQGSNYEVQTQLVIARRLNFGKAACLDEAQRLSIEVGKMLNAMIKRLELSALAAKDRRPGIAEVP